MAGFHKKTKTWRQKHTSINHHSLSLGTNTSAADCYPGMIRFVLLLLDSDCVNHALHTWFSSFISVACHFCNNENNKNKGENKLVNGHLLRVLLLAHSIKAFATCSVFLTPNTQGFKNKIMSKIMSYSHKENLLSKCKMHIFYKVLQVKSDTEIPSLWKMWFQTMNEECLW